MNYAQSFDEFAASLGPTDVALYAGLAIIVWVLFKDKLNPLTSTVSKLIENFRKPTTNTVVIPDVLTKVPTATNSTVSVVSKPVVESGDDVFFQLVSSWKRTRDLAVLAGCVEAVKAADSMFPFLSPNVCDKNKKDVL